MGKLHGAPCNEEYLALTGRVAESLVDSLAHSLCIDWCVYSSGAVFRYQMSQQEQLHIETAESSNRQAGLATEQLQRMHEAAHSANESTQLLAECQVLPAASLAEAPPPVLSNVRTRSLSGMLSTAAQNAQPEEPGTTHALEGVAVGEWQLE